MRLAHQRRPALLTRDEWWSSRLQVPRRITGGDACRKYTKIFSMHSTYRIKNAVRAGGEPGGETLTRNPAEEEEWPGKGCASVGVVQAARFLTTSNPGSALRRPPVSCWSWSWRMAGGYSPQPETVDCEMPSASARRCCVWYRSMAWDVVISCLVPSVIKEFR